MKAYVVYIKAADYNNVEAFLTMSEAQTCARDYRIEEEAECWVQEYEFHEENY